MGNTKRAGMSPIKTEGVAMRAEQSGAGESGGSGETPAKQSLRSMVWTLVAVVAIIFMVVAMWGHLSQNKTSTVNPTKTQPVPRQ